MWWWPPKRSNDERREDISFSLWDIAIALCFLTAGAALGGAGVYFADNAVLGIGLLVAMFGAYCLLQSLFGLLVDLTIGFRGFTLVLVVLIIGFFVVQGYSLLKGGL